MQNLAYTAVCEDVRDDVHARGAHLQSVDAPIANSHLEALHDGEQCVCHLEALLNMRQAYISQQLAVLRKAGIIADRRCGLNIFYRIVKPEVLDLIALARAMTGGAFHMVRDSASPVCSCPKCAEHISKR